MSYSISNLRDQGSFFSAVSDRIWQAWWREDGFSLQAIEQRLAESLESGGVPLTLIAHQGDCFMGTASLIVSDMDEYPDYTPWVAAVWVDEACRGRGIGSALVTATANEAFRMGIPMVYLCAATGKSAFYERLGWIPKHEDISGYNVLTLSSRA